MKAAYLTGIREIAIREVKAPEMKAPDQVLLRVDQVGLCGSDLHYYRTGRSGYVPLPLPFVLGHECCGTLVEAGPEAGGLVPGQRVAVEPSIACRDCDQCRKGRFNTCRNQSFLGFPGQLSGALAELIVLPGRNCFPIPDSMSAEEAVLVEPLSIGLHALRLAGDVTGRKAAVLGSGPIGLSVLLCLRTAGAEAVTMTDLLPKRLALAKRLGAAWTGNPSKEKVVEEIRSLAANGLDFVFECAGEQETLDQAVELLDPGGRLLIIGIPEQERISFRPELLRRKEIRIENVRRQNLCMEEAIDLVASGKVDIVPLATHRFGLEQAGEAFDLAAGYRDGVVKTMIRVSSLS